MSFLAKYIIALVVVVTGNGPVYAASDWIKTAHYTFNISDMRKVEEGDSFRVVGKIAYDGGGSFSIEAECEDRKRGLNIGNFTVLMDGHMYESEEIKMNYRDPGKYIEVAVSYHKIACNKFYP